MTANTNFFQAAKQLKSIKNTQSATSGLQPYPLRNSTTRSLKQSQLNNTTGEFTTQQNTIDSQRGNRNAFVRK